jgi:hypothetical protein
MRHAMAKWRCSGRNGLHRVDSHIFRLARMAQNGSSHLAALAKRRGPHQSCDHCVSMGRYGGLDAAVAAACRPSRHCLGMGQHLGMGPPKAALDSGVAVRVRAERAVQMVGPCRRRDYPVLLFKCVSGHRLRRRRRSPKIRTVLAIGASLDQLRRAKGNGRA